ncbi:MAG: glycoside hydrolase family 5 protein, partial [Sphingomonadales bacterium]
AAYGNPLAANEWPLADAAPRAGKFLAASWQNRPLVQAVPVKKDREVTLTLHARAATPPGFVEPKRLGSDTAAHRALAKIKRGVNLGNGWEAPPNNTWGARFTPEDIDRIADEGFDHIRVPVAWHYYLGESGNEIDPALFAALDPVLRRAVERKLHIMLNWHHFDALTSDPAGQRGRFITIWEAIAEHYRDWPAGLFLELLNEPKDALTTAAANPLYAETIAAIRKIDPQRLVVVSPGQWGNVSELEALRLPDGDERIIVTFHCYDPFYFTHQGANWVNLTPLRDVRYPGPPATPLEIPAALAENVGVRQFVAAYNTQKGERNPSSKRPIREALDLAQQWSAHFGRPVYLGEFGSHQVADAASRERYSR